MAIKELAHEAVGETAVIGDADLSAAVDIPIRELKDRYETLTGAEEVSNSWIGQVRGRLDLEKKRKRDGTVIADHQTVHAYDTSGDRLWQDSLEVGEASVDDEYSMNPMLAVAHDMLYVGLVDGRLYAFGETA